MKRLYRSTENKKVFGVAAGLADYFNMDVTLVRLLFVIFTIAGGPGMLLYIALWIVMPTEADIAAAEYYKSKNDNNYAD